MLTVILAEDEFVVLEHLSSALEDRGYRVLKAGDGADALRLLSSQVCDVVVCDEMMQVMSGAQLVAAMHAEPRLSTIPVIMMVDLFNRPTIPLDPDVAIIAKPVMLPQLFALVEEVAGAKPGPG
jgi:CheY-like chemotaxis protein